jgi:hypothetical protein
LVLQKILKIWIILKTQQGSRKRILQVLARLTKTYVWQD